MTAMMGVVPVPVLLALAVIVVAVARRPIVSAAVVGAVVVMAAAQQKAGGGQNEEGLGGARNRSEEHTSELQSLMRISYAVFCLKKKKTHTLLKLKSQQWLVIELRPYYSLITIARTLHHPK